MALASFERRVGSRDGGVGGGGGRGAEGSCASVVT